MFGVVLGRYKEDKQQVYELLKWTGMCKLDQAKNGGSSK